MANETEESPRIEVKLLVDPPALQDMNHLKDLLHSPNLTTALYNAVTILNSLYQFQKDGYELRLIRNGDSRRFLLPK